MYSQLAPHQAMAAVPMELSQPLAMSVAANGCGADVAALDSLAPKFPPQNFDVPDISLSNSVTAAPSSGGVSGASFPGGSAAPGGVSVTALPGAATGGGYFGSLITTSSSSSSSLSLSSSMQMPPPQSLPMQQQVQQQQQQQVQQQQQRQSPLSTISHSQAAGQLGFQSLRSVVSPAGSHTSSPGRESSEDSDDSLPLAQVSQVVCVCVCVGGGGGSPVWFQVAHRIYISLLVNMVLNVYKNHHTAY